jgi:hypothetical protein
MHTSEFCGPGRWRVFPLHALTFALGSEWCTHVTLHVTTHHMKSSPSSRYSCKNLMHGSTRVRLCSSVNYFGMYLAHILIIEVHVNEEYKYPQLISNLLAISVTVIHLASWSRKLTRSTLSTVREMVGRPKRYSSTTLILPLRKFYPLVQLPLLNTAFSVLC